MRSLSKVVISRQPNHQFEKLFFSIVYFLVAGIFGKGLLDGSETQSDAIVGVVVVIVLLVGEPEAAFSSCKDTISILMSVADYFSPCC